MARTGVKSCLVVGAAGFVGLAACGALLSSIGESSDTAAPAASSAPAPAAPAGSTKQPAAQPSTARTTKPKPAATTSAGQETTDPEITEPEAETTPSATPAPKKDGTWSLVRVVDGDTIRVERGGKEITVRLIGIDTPETKDPSEPVMCGGAEATRYAEKFFSGGKVKLAYDQSQGRLDAYDRTLAYASVSGRDYGLAAIKRGWAAQYLYADIYQKFDAYLAAEEQARADDKGVWGKCGAFDVPLDEREPETTEPEPEPDSESEATEYANCTEVRKAGKAPIRRGEPGYSTKLDRDGDGIACDT